MPLRVATWNLWWRFGPFEQRRDAIVDELARVDADVVCLQEVWARVGDRGAEGDEVVVDDETTADDPATSQAADLAHALDLPHHRHSWCRSHDGLSFGNAILSRHPVTRTVAMPLPAAGRAPEYRTALLVDVAHPEGRAHVATTHTNFLWDQSHVRRVQLAEVTRWLVANRHEQDPIVLTGDLNADPLSDEVRQLTGRAAGPAPGFGFHDAWEVAGDGDGTTWARDNTFTPVPPIEGDKRIDYVLVGHATWDGRGIALRAERVGAVPVAGVGHPSDHFGVVADVTVTSRR